MPLIPAKPTGNCVVFHFFTAHVVTWLPLARLSVCFSMEVVKYWQPPPSFLFFPRGFAKSVGESSFRRGCMVLFILTESLAAPIAHPDKAGLSSYPPFQLVTPLPATAAPWHCLQHCSPNSTLAGTILFHHPIRSQGYSPPSVLLFSKDDWAQMLRRV